MCRVPCLGRAQTCCHVGSLAKGLARILQGEMVVLLFVLAVESRSSTHGQAAAPPVGCIILPSALGQ